MDTPFSTKAVILQELSEGAGYGSAMMERVKQRTSRRLALHSGSVYPALVAMEREGLIRKKKGGAEAGRACYYYLTIKGRKVAQQQRDLAKLIFLYAVEPQAAA